MFVRGCRYEQFCQFFFFYLNSFVKEVLIIEKLVHLFALHINASFRYDRDLRHETVKCVEMTLGIIESSLQV